MKSELEVGDNPVHCRIVGDESDHSNLATALRTCERIKFIDLPGEKLEQFNRKSLRDLIIYSRNLLTILASFFGAQEQKKNQ